MSLRSSPGRRGPRFWTHRRLHVRPVRRRTRDACCTHGLDDPWGPGSNEDEHRRAGIGMPEAMKIWLCAVEPELAAAIRESPGGAQGVLAAADPGEILRHMKVRCPSVVVLGGVSADVVADSCRTLRAAWTCRDAVIVALSEGGPGEVDLLLDAGADDVFIRSSGDPI